MLAVKSTCRDGWRQVLAEADRIDNKHLLTLEIGISTNQTIEMQDKNLQLLPPETIAFSLHVPQQTWLYDLHAFTELVRGRQ